MNAYHVDNLSLPNLLQRYVVCSGLDLILPDRHELVVTRGEDEASLLFLILQLGHIDTKLHCIVYN